MKRLLKQKLSGFSLIEISISLLIIGIISSIVIPQLKAILRLNNSQKTQTNIDFVIRAIGAYYLSTFKLPWPSKIDTNLGEQSESIKQSFGIVPFKTLGIMEKFAKNGNGKWLLYRVNPLFGSSVSLLEQKNLGISEFSSSIPDDKVAIIIKSQSHKNEDELVIWYSEKTFIANFANNKTPTRTQGRSALPGGGNF
jgi:prepilin-type N-terminal cleavage/methylation domain-containing protein